MFFFFWSTHTPKGRGGGVLLSLTGVEHATQTPRCTFLQGPVYEPLNQALQCFLVGNNLVIKLQTPQLWTRLILEPILRGKSPTISTKNPPKHQKLILASCSCPSLPDDNEIIITKTENLKSLTFCPKWQELLQLQHH